MGIIAAMEDGLLIGCHVAGFNTEDTLQTSFRQNVANHGHPVNEFYVLGAMMAHVGFGKSIGDKLVALGAKGWILRILKYAHPKLGVSVGVLARVRSRGPGQASKKLRRWRTAP